MNYKTNICANCGADPGLHKYDNNQCPKNGIEEYRDGKKQEWQDTFFKDSGEKKLEDAAPAMLEALQEIVAVLKAGCQSVKDWNEMERSYTYKKAKAAIEKATT